MLSSFVVGVFNDGEGVVQVERPILRLFYHVVVCIIVVGDVGTLWQLWPSEGIVVVSPSHISIVVIAVAALWHKLELVVILKILVGNVRLYLAFSIVAKCIIIGSATEVLTVNLTETALVVVGVFEVNIVVRTGDGL